jgi:hypothetical protein
VAILVLETMAAFLTRVIPTFAPAIFAEFGWQDGFVGYSVAATTAGSKLVPALFSLFVTATGATTSPSPSSPRSTCPR